MGDIYTNMARKGFVEIQIPKEMDELVSVIAGNKRYGYRGKADFYRDAARRLLMELDVYDIRG